MDSDFVILRYCLIIQIIAEKLSDTKRTVCTFSLDLLMYNFVTLTTSGKVMTFYRIYFLV